MALKSQGTLGPSRPLPWLCKKGLAGLVPQVLSLRKRDRLDHRNFRLEFNAETVLDAQPHVLRHCVDVFAGRLPIIHENKRLLFPYADVAHAITAETRVVDQPCRRQLETASGQRIRNQRRVRAKKTCKGLPVDNRILKEASGVSELHRRGKFSAAQRNHAGIDVLRGKFGEAVDLDLFGKRFVRSIGNPIFGELKRNRSDD